MAKAEAALRSEEERVDAYLHASSRPRLMAAAEVALLASHAEALLGKEGSGVSSLLRDGRRDDLARMYRLFVRVPRGLDPVAAAFRVHVEGALEFFFWGGGGDFLERESEVSFFSLFFLQN
jgi:cullin 1